MRKIKLKIVDLHCPSCVIRLEGIEDDLAGVSSAKASYASQMMEVIYDETTLDQDQIIAAIRKLGYSPTPAG